MSRLLFVVLFCLVLLAPGSARAENLSVEYMAGQMIMAGFRGLDVDETSPVVRDIRERHLGGVILFDRDVALKSPVRNIQSPDQVRRLIARLQGHATTPLLVGVDQEGGRVQRLKGENGFAETPSARRLGAGTLAATMHVGAEVGQQLRNCGFNMDFAPCLDVAVAPDGAAIGALGRSFSSNPEIVAAHGMAFIEGLHSAGVLACIKHFPGHGSAVGDTHLGVVDVTRTWTRSELVPFRQAVKAGLADAVMTAHVFNANLDPERPATLSPDVLGGLLRKELGFSGVVITDDLDMRAVADRYGLERAAVMAVQAGADMLLLGNNLRYDPDVTARVHGALVRAVEAGELTRKRLAESCMRILCLKARLDRP